MKKALMPGNYTAEKIADLIDKIKHKGANLPSKKVTAGFDGFIDTLVKIIKRKQASKPATFINTKKEFGNYILQKQGSSFSLELEPLTVKPGGNMPIMANALGRLGIITNCIGAMGYPQVHPIFAALNPNCRIHSFAEPGTSTAVEFNDGKIILGEMNMLNKTGWQHIKDRIGIDAFVEMYKKSDLLCIVNWAEIDVSTGIWQGLLSDVFPRYNVAGKKQTAFFDLSDCSKRSARSVIEMIGILNKFSQYAKVILGLNYNEARLLHRVLYRKDLDKGMNYLGEKIFEKLSIETLLLHSSVEAIVFNKNGKFTSNSFFVKNPRLSTGAGDNFNAGFCAALLMELDVESSLIFANAVSGLYVRNGISPDISDVINFLEKN